VTARVNPLAPNHALRAAAKRAILSAHGRRAFAARSVRYKPKLKELNGQPCPESLFKKSVSLHQGRAQDAGHAAQLLEGAARRGAELSDLLPHLGVLVDDICIVKSMHTEQIQSRARRSSSAHRRARQGGPGWARGSVMVWAARPRTCPALLCWYRAASRRTARLVVGAAVPAHVFRAVQCLPRSVLFVPIARHEPETRRRSSTPQGT